MASYGTLGILAVALIITLTLISAATSSIITQTQTTDTTTLQQVTTDVTNDLTSYLTIQQILGRYTYTDANPAIHQIALIIRPLVTGTIDLDTLHIELIKDDHILFLTYQNNTSGSLKSSSLFDTPAWNTLTPDNYTALALTDTDNSIQTNHLLNKNTDTAVLLLHLPDDMAFHYDDTCELRLIPSPGHTRQITLDVPYQTAAIAILYEEA